MKEKTFVSVPRGRLISVKINKDEGYITFHYPQERDREFYSIPMDEWVSDLSNRLDRGDNWHHHMMQKMWFSEQMKNFITKSCI